MNHMNLGKYLLVQKLATGGMAEVWIARELELARLVVVKVILDQLSKSPHFRAMFLDEARIVAQLSHPNIVQVYELNTKGDDWFIAMELVLGENLARLQRAALMRGGQVPEAIICRVMAEACRGLHHAHARTAPDGKPLGIVHRDVSPQNIIVTYDGEVKVIDFGIAKAERRHGHTRAGFIKGKYRYMSPEQIRGEETDPRTDIFSAGIVLFELATGTRLFSAASQAALICQINDCRIPRPSDVNPRVSQGLEEIILRALDPRREARFQDAGELRRALDGLSAEHDPPAKADHVAAYVRELCRESMLEKLQICERAYDAKAEITRTTQQPAHPSGPQPVAQQVAPYFEQPTISISGDLIEQVIDNSTIELISRDFLIEEQELPMIEPEPKTAFIDWPAPTPKRNYLP